MYFIIKIFFVVYIYSFSKVSTLDVTNRVAKEINTITVSEFKFN